MCEDQPNDADELLARLPPEWPDGALRDRIREHLARTGEVVVSLDDDPTGVQTVHGIYARTDWSLDALVTEFREPRSLFALLTNSRASGAEAAVATNREIARNLAAARDQTGRPFVVISRSDSTLRGHYPTETDTLAASLGPYDATLLIPAFFEGGRITVDDVHLVRQGTRFVPAALTEFAADRAFGYSSSNLRAWVAEKSGGEIEADSVGSISIATIRQGGPDAVEASLAEAPANARVVVNAASERDLEVVTLAILRLEARGRRYLYRTAASFLRTRAGIEARPPLRGRELLVGNGPGLIVAGSYVGRTGEQLAALVAAGDVSQVELAVDGVLDPGRSGAAIESALRAVNRAMEAGRDTLLYTSRGYIAGATLAHGLEIGRAISRALVTIVSGIAARPSFTIAKGGITAHDIAAEALGARRVEVLGQLAPGVPLWQLGPEARWPGQLYVVFPGNVGGPDALREGLAALRAARDARPAPPEP